MKITFINVGYGESILLEAADPQSPEGIFIMLIDGGSGLDSEYNGNTTGRVRTAGWLKNHRIRHLDCMVLTHIHEDHIGGLGAVAEELMPRVFVQTLPPDFYRTMKPVDPEIQERPDAQKFLVSVNEYRELCRTLETHGCRILQAEAGQECRFTGVPGLNIRFLAPDRERGSELVGLLNPVCGKAEDAGHGLEDVRNMSTEEKYAGFGRTEKEPASAEAICRAADRADAAMNNYSLVMMIEYAGRKILLPGDLDRDGYGPLAREELRADILKVGHHGQSNGISEEIFRQIRPRYTVCCASGDRRYGSAAPELLEMISRNGSELLFSDCPDVPPYTDGLAPHDSVAFEITAEGEISCRYPDPLQPPYNAKAAPVIRSRHASAENFTPEPEDSTSML